VAASSAVLGVAAPPRRLAAGRGLAVGVATLYLSLVVLIPLAAVAVHGTSGGPGAVWAAVRAPEAWSALRLTVVAALVVTVFNAGMGTALAWLLVRDDIPGRRLLDTVVDLPFALPTIVAGLVLLSLYGPSSPVGVDIAYRRTGVVAALLFVTLPFVVRAVQPVLLELDRDAEEAAASLGAGRITVFRRVVLPALLPAISSGAALSFARALSEFGSTVLISGNLPFKTEVASVFVYGRIESDDTTSAAAVSTVLLLVALIVLLVLGLLQRWAVRRG
jgi:sulfate transport system permease protein